MNFTELSINQKRLPSYPSDKYIIFGRSIDTEYYYLDPTHIIDILNYSTLLHYLLQSLDCINVEQSPLQMPQTSITEALNYYIHNSQQCKEKLIQKGQELEDTTEIPQATGIEYYIRKAFQIVAPHLLKRRNFYYSLLQTGDKRLIYESDLEGPRGDVLNNTLGWIRQGYEVSDKLDINLLGILYEKLRTYLKQYPLESISISENIPPVLHDWMILKINDISYCLATFFNYLRLDREGFLKVESGPALLKINPVINYEMVVYLLTEIFPCKGFQTNFHVGKVPDTINKLVIDNIKKEIPESLATELVIYPEVTQYIWNYVSHLMDIIYDNLPYNEKQTKEEIAKLNQDLEKIIKSNEAQVMASRTCTINYGFNDPIENCALQSFIYIIIALSDWLELDEITITEVETAFKIIFPQELRNSNLPNRDNIYIEKIINTAFGEKYLLIAENAKKALGNIMLYISEQTINLADNTMMRLFNRLMFFSSSI